MPAPGLYPGRFAKPGQYGTPLPLPRATTLPATSIQATSAYLNGSTNPAGQATSWWFAWGTTPQYGSVTATQTAGAGSLPTIVGTAISGLAAGVTYHFALVAQSTAGTVYGSDATFIAQAPSAVTNANSPITPIGVTVSQPHLAYPFLLTNAGADVVEQDSLEEVFACVRTIVACPIGACPELPGFGIPEPAFASAPVDPSPIVAAIQRWEPRAAEDAVVRAVGDPNGGSWQVQLTTRVTSENGSPS